MSKILIVDDDETLLDMLRDYLEDFEHVVLKAPNADAAIRLFKDTRPELVIIDVIMANVDGFELLRRLKEISPDFKSIMLSGINDDKCRQMAEDLGADQYFVKPIDLDRFNAIIENLLRTSK